MDIYITNLTTKQRLRLPMLPEEIKGKLGNQYTSYNVLQNGEVKIPSGTELDTYTWSSMFPGRRRRKEPYVKKWVSPKKCDVFFRGLKSSGEKLGKVKANLMVTGTKINLNVYMQSYSPTESGGYGDISYDVTFIRAKELIVSKAVKADASKGNPAAGTADPPKTAKPDSRTSTASKTYTVKSGDSLWAIAQKYYGNGAKYTAIRDANKDLIAKHRGGPNMIWPGDVLKIP